MRLIVSTGSYMKRFNKTIIVCFSLFLVSVISAQFRSQVPSDNPKSPFVNPDQRSSISLLDPGRLSMHHGFSLSMASMGGQSQSYGIYSNQLQYLISNKWSLFTNLNLIQPTHSSMPTGVNTFTGQIYGGAQLLYRPSSSLQLSISVDNYPRLYRNYPANRYSPFPRYYE